MFGLVGALINRRRAPGTKVWIPTESEMAEVGEPLGRIAARRLPDAVTGDVVDGVSAATAATAWALRSMRDEADVRHTPAAFTEPRVISDDVAPDGRAAPSARSGPFRRAGGNVEGGSTGPVTVPAAANDDPAADPDAQRVREVLKAVPPGAV